LWFISGFLMTINHKHHIEIMTVRRAKKKCDIKIRKLRHLVTEMRVSNTKYAASNMAVWIFWLCEYYGRVNIMAVWILWPCGHHDCVDIMTLRTSWLCGYHDFEDIMTVWTSWLCEHHEYVNIMAMWTSWMCEYHGYECICVSARLPVVCYCNIYASCNTFEWY
jgi:hypothetical protein